MKTRNLLLSLVLAISFGLTACNTDYGSTVEQGRCVAFDGKSVTFVRDINKNPKASAIYSNEILNFAMPADPKEKGPDPEFGNLVSLNAEKKEIQVFQNNALSTVPVEIIESKVVASHDDAVKGKSFPMIDKEKGEITVYLNRTLAKFKLPSSLPTDEAFWKTGDSVRVFFHDKGKALRFMNITKTNIFKK